MATAKKLPSGNYRVQVFAGYDEAGKRVYKSFTHKKKAMAELEAAQFIALKNRMKDPEHWTLGEAMDKYIESKEAVLSPSTVRGYRIIRRNNLKPLINLQLHQLSSQLIQKAINDESKTKTPKTIRNIHGFLSSVLKEYHPGLTLKTTMPQKDRTEIYIPTDKELRALLDRVKGKSLELPVLLAALLGLRRSEICALTYADLDRDRKTLSINKARVASPDGGWEVKAPKSYAGYRTLELSDYLLEMLGEGEPSEKIVKITPGAISKRFATYTDGKYNFHALRHYNASVMLANNIPNRYAMERMGHATDNMLKNVYQHLFTDKQRQFTAQLNQHFNSVLQHELSHNEGK